MNICISTKRTLNPRNHTKHLHKQKIFSRRERKKRSRYPATDEKIRPPAPPSSMLGPDVVGQVAVEKKTLVSVFAPATTPPNIEVRGAGGSNMSESCICTERAFFSLATDCPNVCMYV